MKERDGKERRGGWGGDIPVLDPYTKRDGGCHADRTLDIPMLALY